MRYVIDFGREKWLVRCDRCHAPRFWTASIFVGTDVTLCRRCLKGLGDAISRLDALAKDRGEGGQR